MTLKSGLPTLQLQTNTLDWLCFLLAPIDGQTNTETDNTALYTTEKNLITKMQNRPLRDIGPPCPPWCTMEVGGAQRRSVVHSVILYQCGGAQRSSHKPKQAYKHYQTYYLPL